MTVSEFQKEIKVAFPKADYRLTIDGEYRYIPAHTFTFLTSHSNEPETHKSDISYRLTFTVNFFDKDKEEQTFQAPSLQALWETVKATYALSSTQTTQEVETWLNQTAP